jgi:hypothetical protein
VIKETEVIKKKVAVKKNQSIWEKYSEKTVPSVGVVGMHTASRRKQVLIKKIFIEDWKNSGRIPKFEIFEPDEITNSQIGNVPASALFTNEKNVFKSVKIREVVPEDFLQSQYRNWEYRIIFYYYPNWNKKVLTSGLHHYRIYIPYIALVDRTFKVPIMDYVEVPFYDASSKGSKIVRVKKNMIYETELQDDDTEFYESDGVSSACDPEDIACIAKIIQDSKLEKRKEAIQAKADAVAIKLADQAKKLATQASNAAIKMANPEFHMGSAIAEKEENAHKKRRRRIPPADILIKKCSFSELNPSSHLPPFKVSQDELNIPANGGFTVDQKFVDG